MIIIPDIINFHNIISHHYNDLSQEDYDTLLVYKIINFANIWDMYSQRNNINLAFSSADYNDEQIQELAKSYILISKESTPTPIEFLVHKELELNGIYTIREKLKFTKQVNFWSPLIKPIKLKEDVKEYKFNNIQEYCKCINTDIDTLLKNIPQLLNENNIPIIKKIINQKMFEELYQSSSQIIFGLANLKEQLIHNLRAENNLIKKIDLHDQFVLLFLSMVNDVYNKNKEYIKYF